MPLFVNHDVCVSLIERDLGVKRTDVFGSEIML